ARYADLWNGCWFRSPDDADKRLADIDAACADVGRDPASLGRTAGIWVDLPGRTASGSSPARVLDSPDAIADYIRSYVPKGFSHVQLRFDPLNVESVERIGPALEILDRG